jgi:UDP-N-acetylmuramyl-tripeptide synthetase
VTTTLTLSPHATAAEAVAWLRAQGARRLVADSRALQPGDAFLAWPGRRHDARAHLAQAAAAGAVAALVEADGADTLPAVDTLPVARVAGLKVQAGPIASAWFGHPSQALDVLAVTGTNGKTSTSWWLAQALQALGRPCGIAGTLGVGLPGQLQSTGLTTPDAIGWQASLAALRAQGAVACAVEASSIGLDEGRLNGTQVAVALFSNLTQDHLDYHGTMAAYWAAKRQLFTMPGLRAAVVNIDDAHGAELAAELVARVSASFTVWTVSASGQATARLRVLRTAHAPAGFGLDVAETGAHGVVTVQTGLVGAFNVDNLLLVLGGLRALGVPLAEAAAAVAGLQAVPGRLQRVSVPQAAEGLTLPQVVVDYAHTPDALEKALSSLRPWADGRGGRLWCLFGCGGDRDPGKRPLMGAVAARHADAVVLTSDNPRSEDPRHILVQVAAGIPAGCATPVHTDPDRRAAIAWAVQQAGPQDVVLVAGKGHETVQEVAGHRLPFSDADEAAQALARRLQEARA